MAAEASLAQAAEQRSEAEAASASGTEALKAVRAQAATVSGELDTVVNTAHGTEISRNEHRLRLEQLAAHATDESILAWLNERVRPGGREKANRWVGVEKASNLDRQDSEEGGVAA